MPATFLVTGATGKQGGGAARELLKAGAKVHALIRDPLKPAAKELEALGAVLFKGDYADIAAIERASAGVKGVFINPYPEFDNADGQRAQVQRFIDAARAAGTVDTLVLSTSAWVPFHEQWLKEDPDYPVKDRTGDKWAAEAAIRGAGFKYYTILRPPWLVHNYAAPINAFHFPQFATIGELHTPINVDQPIAHLDAYDIGRFAAAALLDPARFTGQELSLAVGNFSIREAARELEAVIGSKIPVVQLDAVDFIGDESNLMNRVRGGSAKWTNEKGIFLTEEQIKLQNSFGIELTTLRAAFERNKSALPVKST